VIFTKFSEKVAHGPLKKTLDLMVIWIRVVATIGWGGKILRNAAYVYPAFI